METKGSVAPLQTLAAAVLKIFYFNFFKEFHIFELYLNGIILLCLASFAQHLFSHRLIFLQQF